MFGDGQVYKFRRGDVRGRNEKLNNTPHMYEIDFKQCGIIEETSGEALNFSLME